MAEKKSASEAELPSTEQPKSKAKKKSAAQQIAEIDDLWIAGKISHDEYMKRKTPLVEAQDKK